MMIKRLLLLVSVMGLAVASAASNFNLNFYQPTVVNGTTLKIGEAKLEIRDNKAIVKQGKTSVEANIKVETANSKYLYTTIGYKDADNHQIKDITLAGTTTKLVFEKSVLKRRQHLIVRQTDTGELQIPAKMSQRLQTGERGGGKVGRPCVVIPAQRVDRRIGRKRRIGRERDELPPTLLPKLDL